MEKKNKKKIEQLEKEEVIKLESEEEKWGIGGIIAITIAITVAIIIALILLAGPYALILIPLLFLFLGKEMFITFIICFLMYIILTTFKTKKKYKIIILTIMIAALPISLALIDNKIHEYYSDVKLKKHLNLYNKEYIINYSCNYINTYGGIPRSSDNYSDFIVTFIDDNITFFATNNYGVYDDDYEKILNGEKKINKVFLEKELRQSFIGYMEANDLYLVLELNENTDVNILANGLYNVLNYYSDVSRFKMHIYFTNKIDENLDNDYKALILIREKANISNLEKCFNLSTDIFNLIYKDSLNINSETIYYEDIDQNNYNEEEFSIGDNQKSINIIKTKLMDFAEFAE